MDVRTRMPISMDTVVRANIDGNFPLPKGYELDAPNNRLIYTGLRVSTVQANKAAGDAWEREVNGQQLPQTQNDIKPQITIKSDGPSGKRVRADAVGTDKTTGKIRVTDAKASPTAPLTPNQTVVYPELEVYGGTVVGEGKSPYTGGTQIPPTKVDIIRKPKP